MRRLVSITTLLAAFAATAFAAENPRIEVTANARTLVRPDQATMHVSVTAVAKNTEQAIGELQERVKAVRALLKKQKLKDANSAVSEIEVNANVSHLGKKVLKEGYYAKLQMVFTLIDLKQLEDFSAQLAELQGVEFGKPTFGRTDAADLRRQTLKKAFANAQAEGKFIADALGIKLGSPVFARKEESYSGRRYNQQYGYQGQMQGGNGDPFGAQPAQQEGAASTERLDSVLFASEVTVYFGIEK